MKKANQADRNSSRGITVIEVLIVLGLLVVILSFATPTLSNVTAKAELLTAAENVEFSIRVARNTARQLETEVVMHLENDRKLKQHTVSFSVPGKKSAMKAADLLQTYQFPEGIRLVSETREIHFDARGIVNPAVPLMIVSSQNDEINRRFLIE